MRGILHLLDEDVAAVNGAGNGDIVHGEGLVGQGHGVAAVGIGDEDGSGLLDREELRKDYFVLSLLLDEDRATGAVPVTASDKLLIHLTSTFELVIILKFEIGGKRWVS